MKNISLRETQCEDYEIFYRGHYIGIIDTTCGFITSSFLTDVEVYYNCFDHLEAICRLAYFRTKGFAIGFSNQGFPIRIYTRLSSNGHHHSHHSNSSFRNHMPHR
jgi:hypothetical protein